MLSKSKLYLVYLSGFLLAIHFASVTYVNSSLLRQFVGDSAINILYIVGSTAGVFLLLIAPFLLRKYGSVAVFLALTAAEIITVWSMGTAQTKAFIVPLFLLHIAIDSMLLLCLDINLEQEIKSEENTTGVRRGLLLTFSNVAWVASPLALVFLISQNGFGKIYWLSGIALIPLFIIISLFFKNAEKASTRESNIISSLKLLSKGGDKSRIIMVQFILNFFYAWMVIYLPLLLSREIGFGWDKIGYIFVIMLLPFLLFELPAGMLSDKKLGEKELIVAGFIIMFLSTIILPLITVQVFSIWALALFITRLGASLVEVSTESYFFKQVQEDDTGLISLFRIARPLSYIIAPLFALPIIFFFSYSASFYFLSFFTLLGLFFIPKVDTK